MMNVRPARNLLLVLFAALALRAQEGDLAERLFLSGERAYASRSFAEALDTWNQLLRQAPTSDFAAQALLRMARHAYEVEQKSQEALGFLDKLKAEHMESPSFPDGLLLRGVILASRAARPADLKEAVAEFNRLLDLFPNHPAVAESRYHLGLALRLQGQWAKALAQFIEAQRRDPDSPTTLKAMLQAAEVMDLQGDLTGAVRMLQAVRNTAPQSAEAAEALWKIGLRVQHRIRKAPLRSLGPWPRGKQKWLKSPTLVTVGEDARIYLFQDGLDRVFRLKGEELEPLGAEVKGLRGLLADPRGQLCLLSSKTGLIRGEAPPVPLQGSPSCAAADAWGTLWIGDSKSGQLTLLGRDGAQRSLPSPAAVALTPLPSGGMALASDANRALLILDANGQPKATIPYGQGLPAPFKYVLAMNSDPAGHIAAITDGGDFEGLVVWGPDGTLLRSATFKELGLNGKYRGVALDREGGILLSDRSNDLLVRVY